MSYPLITINVVPTKNPSEFFCSLSNISKDAEIQVVSEYGFILLGCHDSTGLEAKYQLTDEHKS
jgi:hypothetical protein